MSRYIDADLIEYQERFDGECGEIIKVAFVNDIDCVPTADVVEVVRCKDCKHKDYCCRNVVKFDKDEERRFCSYGERR